MKYEVKDGVVSATVGFAPQVIYGIPRLNVKGMNTIKDVNSAQAYMVGMLYAAFGERAFNCDAVEEHIEAAKEYAKKRKEEEIDNSTLSPTEKENQKRLWKQWIDETTKGVKDELKRAGRIV